MSRCYFQDPNSAFADISERVSEERVESCFWNGEFDDHPTARGYRDGLIPNHMVGRVAISIGITEECADDMEGRELGGTGIHKKDADALPCFGRYRVRFILVDVAVKHHIVRNPVVHLGRVDGI